MMKEISVICCSVLSEEVKIIIDEDYPDLKVKYLDSLLHMHPNKLQKQLDNTILKQKGPTLIIYGDCGPTMSSIEQRFECIRTNAVNCNELLLGESRYKEFRNNKVFIFLPEWTKRWKEVFVNELGFNNRDLARMFMQENNKSLKYIDTGIIPVPEKTLKEIEEYFNMPIKVISESLTPLRKYIHEAINRLISRYNNG